MIDRALYMPIRHEPYSRDFNFRYFDVFGLTDFDTIISVQDDPRLKDDLINVRNSICGAIEALEHSLTSEIQNRHNVQETTFEKIEELESLIENSIAKTVGIYMEFYSKLAEQLDELYISDETKIKTKDRLYEIRQLVNSFNAKFIFQLDGIPDDIRDRRKALEVQLNTNL